MVKNELAQKTKMPEPKNVSLLLLRALDFGGIKHAAAVVAFGERHWLKHQRALSPPTQIPVVICFRCDRASVSPPGKPP